MRSLDWLKRLWRPRRDEATIPLYRAIVTRARAEHWYVAGAVPDTVDGRFDAIAAVLSIVLMRLEQEPEGTAPATALAEHFVDDMDAQLRQIGFGDMVVGKQVGRMMAALGGRLGAYRDAFAGGSLEDALIRNLYRDEAPSASAVEHVATELRRLHGDLSTRPIETLLNGELP
ncbi:ubiquinol-cytochrome C chaperone [Sphingomonas sp. Leaf339]|uniref:ubiquinol-cytochrome C chaperone family protein n=1 Tax=Sphingomonas sp. Leaf339 TaxID=1736343 RepID=UPI0006FD08BF|nr:ubiquinol-cytochrome C chaperone family protein [Sphingomonas sp. Leaf339]KQU53211.1 ubiquinol-cytochrome C chaperone [Sphingomonas sp. Leaf339]